MNDLTNVLKEWTGVTRPFLRERSVLDFFQAQVQSHPESVAVKDGERLLTYRELDAGSNRVAQALHRGGLRLEEPVMVLLPASCDFLTAILGILKAGGSYLPVDTETPVKRVEFLLSDSKCGFLLSDASGLARLSSWPGKALDLRTVLANPGSETAEAPRLPADANRRAYITYTSGSTGQPKGVEIEHHALTNFVCCYHARFDLTAKDRSSMLAYVAFDASVADIWPTLCAGGTIVIPPKGILLTPDVLIEWLVTEEITLTFVPTGLAEILFARPWLRQMQLRFFVTGGDRLRVRPPPWLPFIVINGYGPTETTVFGTWAVVKPDDGTATPPSIGSPLINTTAYVLDEQLQPTPVTVAGELYLGGEQVARGYLGRPDLTNERFLPDPFAGKPGARMYRTGDWARWLPDGELDFLGRKDGQIQIRGRRVELGEIEATLFTHDAVQQVCCVPWLDEGMPSGVIAHLVAKTPRPGLADEWRAWLHDRLPDYMVPAEFVLHDVLPLTPQGKVDRAALTALQSVKHSASQITPGEDGLQKALAGLWHGLLPAAESSAPDAIFAALGGDSLLAIKLMLGVEEITGQRLEVSNFLIKPTFAGLCEAVKACMSRTAFEPVLALRKSGTRPPLFCLYGYAGDVQSYFELTEALGHDQPVFCIRSPALEDLSKLPQSMEAAAAEVIPLIRKIQPHGAPALVGYSWAGLLTYEVARQLEQTEKISCFIALIGPTAPMRAPNFATRTTHFARHAPRWLWHQFRNQETRRRIFKRWRQMVSRAGRNLFELQMPHPEGPSSPIASHLMGLMEKYNPPKTSLSLDLFREREFLTHPLHAWHQDHLPDCGWNSWTTTPPRIHSQEGDHWTLVRLPFVTSLGRSVRQAMDAHFKIPTPTFHAPEKSQKPIPQP